MSTTAQSLNKVSTGESVGDFQKLFQSSLSIMILTLIHHAYGALIYDDPFRLHVVYIAIPVILLLAVSFKILRSNTSWLITRISSAIFILVSAAIPISIIGLYEGGYNHLLKNLLYYGGASQANLDRLFPPPMYEMPNNYFFEVTGIFQFIFGIYAIYCVMQIWMSRSKSDKF